MCVIFPRSINTVSEARRINGVESNYDSLQKEKRAQRKTGREDNITGYQIQLDDSLDIFSFFVILCGLPVGTVPGLLREPPEISSGPINELVCRINID